MEIAEKVGYSLRSGDVIAVGVTEYIIDDTFPTKVWMSHRTCPGQQQFVVSYDSLIEAGATFVSMRDRGVAA